MFPNERRINMPASEDNGPNKKSQYPLFEYKTLRVKQPKMRVVPIKAVIIKLGLISITCCSKGPIPIPKKINIYLFITQYYHKGFVIRFFIPIKKLDANK